MGFLASKKRSTNLESKWVNSTFKPVAEGLLTQGQGGLAGYLEALMSGGGPAFQQYEDSTGYGGIFDEAMRGVTANTAAKGLLSSGAMIRAAQDRAAELKKQSFSNYLAQLLQGSQAGLSGGMNAGNTVANVGSQMKRTGGFSNFLDNLGKVGQTAGQLVSGFSG